MRVLLVGYSDAEATFRALLLATFHISSDCVDTLNEAIDFAAGSTVAAIIAAPDCRQDWLARVGGPQGETPVLFWGEFMASTSEMLCAGVADVCSGAMDIDEIAARIERAAASKVLIAPRLSFAGVDLQPEGRVLAVGGVSHQLTAAQVKLLSVLFRRPGRVFGKQYLLDQMYADCDQPCPKIIDVFICKIRPLFKASDAEIRTVWGQGYCLVKREVKDAA